VAGFLDVMLLFPLGFWVYSGADLPAVLPWVFASGNIKLGSFVGAGIINFEQKERNRRPGTGGMSGRWTAGQQWNGN